jgi:hypothetical protein
MSNTVKFICKFADVENIAVTTMEIPVELTAEDFAELDGIRERQKERDKQNLPPDTDLDVVAMAMALRHAYKVAPDGYSHLAGGVHPVAMSH